MEAYPKILQQKSAQRLSLHGTISVNARSFASLTQTTWQQILSNLCSAQGDEPHEISSSSSTDSFIHLEASRSTTQLKLLLAESSRAVCIERFRRLLEPKLNRGCNMLLISQNGSNDRNTLWLSTSYNVACRSLWIWLMSSAVPRFGQIPFYLDRCLHVDVCWIYGFAR